MYAKIERQNLPDLFRTFDFASPDAHAPQRFTTTVPQQALFMMNSPFVVESARHVASLVSVAAAPDPATCVKGVYEAVLRRPPDRQEARWSESFLESSTQDLPPSPIWQYGYGEVDLALGTVNGFTELPRFNGRQYTGLDGDLPDGQLGWTSLHSGGGHPGEGSRYATVIRWIAPKAGVVRVLGKVNHPSEQGDGVRAVLTSEDRSHWARHVREGSERLRARGIEVEAGQSVDLAVHCGRNTGFDSFNVEMTITLEHVNGSEQEFDYGESFGPPPPPILRPPERLAQVLLMSNEFMFID